MRQLLLSFLFVILPVVASADAYDVKIDGIYYNLVSKVKGATVTKNPNKYSGIIDIPESVTYGGVKYTVTSIGSSAFGTCSGLTSVTIPTSVTSIGYGAFYGCSGLTSVTIPTSVTSIGESAFSRCSSLTSIIVERGNTKYDSRNNCNAIIEKSSNSLVAGCMNTSIPNTVTSIGDRAFDGCSSLTSVTIPNSVTYIGTWAFYQCFGLLSVTIPSSVTAIGKSAFECCQGLTSVTIPNSVTFIGSYAFSDCSGLTSVTIPNSVSSIGDNPFRSCSKLTSIIVETGNTDYDSRNNCNAIIETSSNSLVAGCMNTSIPNSVTSIGSYAFYGCSGLTSVTIPNSVTSIGNFAFAVSGLTSVTIPNSVTSIGSYAFHCCYDLNSVTIPNSVTSIGSYTFYGCTLITSVTSEIESPNVVTGMFVPFSSKAKLYIPRGTKIAYQSAGWTSYFYEVIEVDSSPIEHTLSIMSKGYGSVEYGSSTIRSQTTSFIVNEGSTIIFTFTPDAGYRIMIVKVNGTDVTTEVSDNRYTVNNINSDTTVEVEFEAIPSTTYSLTIKAIGNGAAAYNGTEIRGGTSSFTIVEGNDATITFAPDSGNRIKNVKVNGSDVTSSVSNNQYTINNINKNTTIEVEFEAIPLTYYSLTVKAIGNGNASYNGTTVRSNTGTFTVVEGTTAIITFTPDEGYRVKSLMVNNSDVTSEIIYNKYTIDFINNNTVVEVEFEKTAENEGQSYAFLLGSWNAIGNDYFSGGAEEEWTATFEKDPIGQNKVWIHNICSGGCSASYAVYGIVTEDKTEIHIPVGQTTAVTSSYDVILEGFRDEGKTDIEKGDYIVGKISEDGTITIEDWFGAHAYQLGTTTSAGWYAIEMGAIFKKQSPISSMLTINSIGNGSAVYNGMVFRNSMPSFKVLIGSPITITFTPDNGYRIMSVKVNGVLVASDVSTYQYTVSYISSDTTVEVEFMEQLMAFSSNGVNYSVASYDDRTVAVGSGNYGKALEVPANVSYQEKTWKVTGIDNATMADNAGLAAVIWNPETQFTPNVSNPNFLLYVKSADYAPSTVKNVVVNGSAKSITLTEAPNGNDFYCPQEFTAQRISYTHNYMMTTGIGESRGWETIALPFDVQQVTHQSGDELVPFAKWQSGNEGKPFWLMELGSSGWTEATAIKANTPYIISMPNNDNYKPEFRVNGNVTFKAENVTVRRSDETESRNGNGKTFVPNFTNQESAGYYALNVSNDYVTYSGGAAEGSRFVAGLRPVRPFEAYMTSEAGVREIAIADDLATGIAQAIVLIGGRGDTKVYDLKGRVVADGAGCSQEELRRMLPYGVYIFNGRKLIVK